MNPDEFFTEEARNSDFECGAPIEHRIAGLRKCRRPKQHLGNHKPVIQVSDIPGLAEAVRKARGTDA